MLKKRKTQHSSMGMVQFCHNIKKISKSQKIKILSILIVCFVLSMFLIFNDKSLSEFVSNLVSKNENIKYAELDITDAKLYTEEKQTLTEYEQQTVEDTIIKKVIFNLSFNVDSAELYDDKGKWHGQAMYKLPDCVKAVAEDSKGYIYNNGKKVGTFVANADNVIFNFYEKEMSKGNLIFGDFSFWGEIDFSSLDHSGDFNVKFDTDVSYDVYIPLCTQLELYKSVSDPIVDQAKSTITFNYEVKMYSPGSTHGHPIDIHDTITDIVSQNENVTRKITDIIWTDYDGNEKTIPKQYSFSFKGYKELIGTMPPMEAGDTIIIKYSVIEQATTWTNGTYQQANKVTADVNDEVHLEASAKSSSVHFVGDEWYDLFIKKKAIEADAIFEETYKEIPYEITIDSSIGTKKHDIEFTDNLIISKSIDSEKIKFEDLKIYKVTGDNRKELSIETTVKFLNQCTKNTDNTSCNTLGGTLPALEEGEKYLITYKLRIDESADNESYTIDNTATATAGKLKVEAKESVDASGEKPSLDSDYTTATGGSSGYCNASCGYGYRSYGGSIDFTITLNENGAILKTTHKLDATVDTNEKTFDAYFYSKDPVEMYKEQKSFELPIHFEKENQKFYAVDSQGTKVEMKSTRDKIILKYHESSSGQFHLYLNANLIESEKEIANTSESASVGGKRSCYKSCYSPPPTPYSPPPSPTPPRTPTPYSPYCPYDNNNEVKTEYSSNTKVNEEGTIGITWLNTITINNELTDFTYYNFLALYSATSSDYLYDITDHYYTKTQLQNIKVYGVNEDGTKVTLKENEDYTIYARYCSGENTSCEDYKALSELTNEKYYTTLKLVFKEDTDDTETTESKFDNYEEIVYEVESTGYVNERTIASFSNAIYNNSRYNDSDCDGYVKVNWTYENLPEVAGDVLQKYNLNEDGTTSKSNNFSYMEDTEKDKIDFYYKTVINKDGTIDGDITFTDELPRGVHLVQENWTYGNIKCSSTSTCKNGILVELNNVNSEEKGNAKHAPSYPADSIKVNYDEKTNVLTVTIPESLYKRKDYEDPNYLSITLYYKVHVDDIFTRDTRLTNKATVKSKNADQTDSATNRMLLPKFDKYFEEYEERKGLLTYFVKINEFGEMMLDGKDVTVVDEIKYQNPNKKITKIDIVKATIYKLVNGEKGEKIKDLEVTTEPLEEGNGMRIYMDIPDGTPLYLEYTYKIDLANDYPDYFEMSNKISIKGVDEAWAKDAAQEQSRIVGITANAYTNATNMTLVKVDTNNVSQPLKGATFRVEKYTGKDWKSIGDFTTNEDGYVEIGEQHMSGDLIIYSNVAYRAKEIKAPTGYALDSKYNYIYVYNPLIKRELIPKGFDKNNVINNKENVATVKDYIINIPTGDILNIVLITLAVVGTLLVFLFVIRPKVRYEKVD